MIFSNYEDINLHLNFDLFLLNIYSLLRARTHFALSKNTQNRRLRSVKNQVKDKGKKLTSVADGDLIDVY